MRTLRFAMLASFFALLSTRGEDARFFRISGPSTSIITVFNADGFVTWTNSQTSAVFTVQTATSPFGSNNWADYVQIPVTNGVTTWQIHDPNPPSGMAFIPAGLFTMGNTFAGEGASDELPTHVVYVSAFYMDRYEIAKATWDAVYNWAITNGYSFDRQGFGKAVSHPVQSINWFDMIKWCNARSQKEGLNPCYYTTPSQTILYKTGQMNLTNACVNWNANGYRLPTEAEWEKAAKGGAGGHRFPWGDAETIKQSRANYTSAWSSGTPAYPFDVNTTSGAHPTFNNGVYPYTSQVGYFAPNGFGLYDMAGNVWEWCWDMNGAYSSSLQSDPRGPASGTNHVARGGGYYSDADSCRTANRAGYADPTYYNDGIGFRCVRGL